MAKKKKRGEKKKEEKKKKQSEWEKKGRLRGVYLSKCVCLLAEKRTKDGVGVVDGFMLSATLVALHLPHPILHVLAVKRNSCATRTLCGLLK